MTQPESEADYFRRKYNASQEAWIDMKYRHKLEISDLRRDLKVYTIAANLLATAALVLFGLLVLIIIAHAEPPANADPALAPWFHSLTQPDTGYLCCSVADCRPVKTRQKDGHIEAFIDNVQFKTGPNDWVRVPENVILHGNPPHASNSDITQRGKSTISVARTPLRTRILGLPHMLIVWRVMPVI